MVSICMQGPWSKYTENIIKHYHDIEPQCPIFLCTYDDAPIDILQKLHDTMGLKYVLLDEKSFVSGERNRNKQRITSFNALNLAHQNINKQLHFAVKVRTDHVLVDKFSKRMMDLIMKYPINSKLKHGNYIIQNDRIIVCDKHTTLETFWGSFHIADLFMFGNMYDLLAYWSIDNPFWNKNEDVSILENGITHAYLPAGVVSPESEFTQLWMKHLRIENFYNEIACLLADRFIVVDLVEYNYHILKDVDTFCSDTNQIRNLEPPSKIIGDPKIISHEMWKDFYENLS